MRKSKINNNIKFSIKKFKNLLVVVVVVGVVVVHGAEKLTI